VFRHIAASSAEEPHKVLSNALVVASCMRRAGSTISVRSGQSRGERATLVTRYSLKQGLKSFTCDGLMLLLGQVKDGQAEKVGSLIGEVSRSSTKELTVVTSDVIYPDAGF
jgi:hypothetical protein